MLRLRKEKFLFKYLQLKLTRKSTRFCWTILNYPHPPKENRALTWYLKNPETTKIQPSRLFLGQAESVPQESMPPAEAEAVSWKNCLVFSSS